MRITAKQVEERIKNVNSQLPDTYQLELSHRNYHYAIDIKNIEKGTSRETYDCGLSCREAYQIVCAMGAAAYQIKKEGK